MEGPTILPDELHRGAILFHHGKPFVIHHVEACVDPFTKRPALNVRIDDETATQLFFLVLTCECCGRRVAAKFNESQKVVQWAEVRYAGAYRWICPECIDTHFPMMKEWT